MDTFTSVPACAGIEAAAAKIAAAARNENSLRSMDFPPDYCGVPEYVFGVKPIGAFDGSLNSTPKVPTCPGDSGKRVKV